MVFCSLLTHSDPQRTCSALLSPTGHASAPILAHPVTIRARTLVLPCVGVFVADEFCIWATILRTCLSLHCGAQLADVPCVCVADMCWGTQLADVPCVALRRPTCGRATCLPLWTCLAFALQTCVGVPNLWTCLALHWGAQLADVPCITLGRPTLVRTY